MYLKVNEAKGITGASVEFTSQELVAIKDKWEIVNQDLGSPNDATIADFNEEVTVNRLALIEMDILMDKLLHLVPSTKEIHIQLFEPLSGQEKLDKHLAGKLDKHLAMKELRDKMGDGVPFY